MFDEVAPAMPFFLPRGAFVYNRLIQYMRDLYEGEGYEEVVTPQIFDPKLFRDERAPRQLQREHVPPLDRGRCVEEVDTGGTLEGRRLAGERALRASSR